MYAEYFQSQDVPCVAVSTVADALGRVADADVVVTGVLLHGDADGIELIHRLRANEPTKRTPIVVLTACALDNERQRAEQAGCDAFLSKPCLPESVLQTIQRVFASSKLQPLKGNGAKRNMSERVKRGAMKQFS